MMMRLEREFVSRDESQIVISVPIPQLATSARRRAWRLVHIPSADHWSGLNAAIRITPGGKFVHASFGRGCR